jgi:hypothetical protein
MIRIDVSSLGVISNTNKGHRPVDRITVRYHFLLHIPLRPMADGPAQSSKA